MNFNCGVKSISISSHAKKVYEELDTIRPKHISFSLMLAIAADDYVKNHSKGLVKLDEFSTEDIGERVPSFFSDVDEWIGYISRIDGDERKRFQQRLLQIQTIIEDRS